MKVIKQSMIHHPLFEYNGNIIGGPMKGGNSRCQVCGIIRRTRSVLLHKGIWICKPCLIKRGFYPILNSKSQINDKGETSQN